MPLTECADGIDNDQDGRIDFAGGDLGCTAAGDRDERPTCETELPRLPENGLAVGTTGDGMPENQGSCSFDTGAPDVVYVVPVQSLPGSSCSE